jgi:hypothetical protein
MKAEKASQVLARARAQQALAISSSVRVYPVLEALVGAHAQPSAVPAVRAFSGSPMPSVKKKRESGLSTRLSETRELPAHAKFQQLIEKTVKTLLLTASEEGELVFRADVDAAVMNDLSVDVAFEGKQLSITFYTEDSSVRRLLQGYERELHQHLSSRGSKVKKVRFEKKPDPGAPTAVPVLDR